MNKTIEEKTFDLLESTGLNWSVTKEPLVSITGDIFKDGSKPTGSFGIFRNDSNNWLGTVGKQYETFQNSQLAEMIVRSSEELDLNVTRGGQLNGGRKVYLQVELPQAMIGKGMVKRWLSALNTHDGSSSIGFGSSNTTIICNNTFAMAFHEVPHVRHTANVKERVDEMVKSMRITMGLDDKLMENFKRMADLPLKDEIVERVLRRMFDIDADTKQEELGSRKLKRIKSFSGAVEQSVKEQGATVWALLNGVTRYTNHIAAPTNEDKKLDYIMDGRGAEISTTAYNELMRWVEENTAEYVLVGK